jgi:hypothetical protein
MPTPPHPNPAIAELLSFFEAGDLPSALARPFLEVAEAIATMTSRPVARSRVQALASAVSRTPGREAIVAIDKLKQLHDVLSFSRDPKPLEMLRTLLEAKDCVVRAELVLRRGGPTPQGDALEEGRVGG